VPAQQAAAMLQDSGGYGDIIRAAGTIASSPDRAAVLLAVLRRGDVRPADLTQLYQVAGAIASDPSRRDVLKEAAERYPLTNTAVRRAFFGATAAFAACPERRDVLLAVLQRSGDPDVVSAVILSARAMPADAERRDVYLRVADRATTPDVQTQLINASREMVSSPVRRDVLVKLLSRPGLSTPVLRAAFGAAAEIVASPEKRDVLTYGAAHQRIEGDAREMYLTAANSIVSSPERAEAIQALLGVGAAAPASAPRAGTSGTWDTQVQVTDDDGRVVNIHANGVLRGPVPEDIRAIRPGGALVVEEIRNGQTRRVEVTPSASGALTTVFKVNGRTRPFDHDAEAWLDGILKTYARK
ncbi:MAG TPA: hypothetical protein VJT67_03990, partial [Longimicrobiaceae bacterium]|nr:hypothetical protein [Longimicrobiaceae bacterium]